MKEPEVWKLLAEAWASSKVGAGRIPFAKLPRGTYHCCICSCLDSLCFNKVITNEIRQQMSSRLPITSRLAWPLTEAGAKDRAAFCQKMWNALEKDLCGISSSV